MSRIYVGNLAYEATESQLRSAFEAHGTVRDVRIMIDRETGRSRGFAFVEMGSDDEARRAIKALDGHDMEGRNLRVNEARPRDERGGGGGGGGGGGRGGRW